MSERIEMAESIEKPVGAMALEGRLVKDTEYSDDSTAKPISKKKNTRKRRHGESTESRYGRDD